MISKLMHQESRVSFLGTFWGRLLVVGVLFLVGTILLSVSPLVYGEFQALSWVLKVNLVGASTLLLAALTHRYANTLFRLLLFAYCALLLLPVLTAGFVRLVQQRAGRVDVLFGDANLLGAAICISVLVLVAIGRPRYPSWVLLLLGVVAVLVTGSRTAFIAMLIGAGLVVIMNYWRRQVSIPVRLAIAMIALVIGAVFGGIVLTNSQGSASGNLLQYSDSWRHESWVTSYAEAILITEVDAVAPAPKGAVQRVRASGSKEETGLLLVQSTVVSEPGLDYVASVYTRSDESQTISLGSNLAFVSCAVTNKWTRCSTPPARGNGRTRVQFQLLLDDDADSLSADFWGAQVEVGQQAGDVYHTTPTRLEYLLHNSVLNRFTLDQIISGQQSRAEAFSTALSEFLRSPVFGVGRSALNHTLASVSMNSAGTFAHAHNIFVQILAEGGLVALTGWLLIVGGTLKMLPTAARHHLVPLLAAVIVLNSLDYTWYHMGSYYIYWVAIGAGLSAGTARGTYE